MNIMRKVLFPYCIFFILYACLCARVAVSMDSVTRFAANRLAEAELFSTVNSITGATYPWDELDRISAFINEESEHITTAAGKSGKAKPDNIANRRAALKSATTVRDEALRDISSVIDTSKYAPGESGRPIIIFNSLSWKRTDVVEADVEFDVPVDAFYIVDRTGARVAFQLTTNNVDIPFTSARVYMIAGDVPATGYSVFYPVPSQKFPVDYRPARLKGTWIENDLYRIESEPGECGGLGSIYGKKLNKEFMRDDIGVGNDVVAIVNKAAAHETRSDNNEKKKEERTIWYLNDSVPKNISLIHGAVFDRIVVVSNPVYETTGRNGSGRNVEKKLKKKIFPEIVRETTIYRSPEIRRIDFTTYINAFDGADIRLMAMFPLTITNGVLLSEKRLTALTNNWVDYGPGQSVDFIDDRGNVVGSYPMNICEIIVPADKDVERMADELAAALSVRGVETTKVRADNAAGGEYDGFSISLGVGGNNEFTNNIEEYFTYAERNIIKSGIAANGVGTMFAKSAGSIIAASGNKSPHVLVLEAADSASLRKKIDVVVEQLKKSGNIVLPIRVNASGFIATAPEYGFALLGAGGTYVSVDADDRMKIPFLHASDELSEETEDDSRGDKYRYAVVPHAGDWRDAGLIREGYEYNFPLIAVSEGLHSGSLPGSVSFISIDGRSTIMYGLKPLGSNGKEYGKMTEPEGRIAVKIFNYSDMTATADLEFFIPLRNIAGVDEATIGKEPVSEKNGDRRFAISLKPFERKTLILTTEDDRIEFIPSVEKNEAGVK